MKTIEKYKIIKKLSRSNLEKEVTKALEAGAELHGPLQIIVKEKGKTEYIQVIIKTEKIKSKGSRLVIAD